MKENFITRHEVLSAIAINLDLDIEESKRKQNNRSSYYKKDLDDLEIYLIERIANHFSNSSLTLEKSIFKFLKGKFFTLPRKINSIQLTFFLLEFLSDLFNYSPVFSSEEKQFILPIGKNFLSEDNLIKAIIHQSGVKENEIIEKLKEKRDFSEDSINKTPTRYKEWLNSTHIPNNDNIKFIAEAICELLFPNIDYNHFEEKEEFEQLNNTEYSILIEYYNEEKKEQWAKDWELKKIGDSTMAINLSENKKFQKLPLFEKSLHSSIKGQSKTPFKDFHIRLITSLYIAKAISKFIKENQSIISVDLFHQVSKLVLQNQKNTSTPQEKESIDKLNAIFKKKPKQIGEKLNKAENLIKQLQSVQSSSLNELINIYKDLVVAETIFPHFYAYGKLIGGAFEKIEAFFNLKISTNFMDENTFKEKIKTLTVSQIVLIELIKVTLFSEAILEAFKEMLPFPIIQNSQLFTIIHKAYKEKKYLNGILNLTVVLGSKKDLLSPYLESFKDILHEIKTPFGSKKSKFQEAKNKFHQFSKKGLFQFVFPELWKLVESLFNIHQGKINWQDIYTDIFENCFAISPSNPLFYELFEEIILPLFALEKDNIEGKVFYQPSKNYNSIYNFYLSVRGEKQILKAVTIKIIGNAEDNWKKHRYQYHKTFQADFAKIEYKTSKKIDASNLFSYAIDGNYSKFTSTVEELRVRNPNEDIFTLHKKNSTTALILAAENNNWNIVEWILQQPEVTLKYVEHLDFDGTRFLNIAIHENQIEPLKAFLKINAKATFNEKEFKLQNGKNFLFYNKQLNNKYHELEELIPSEYPEEKLSEEVIKLSLFILDESNWNNLHQEGTFDVKASGLTISTQLSKLLNNTFDSLNEFEKTLKQFIEISLFKATIQKNAPVEFTQVMDKIHNFLKLAKASLELELEKIKATDIQKFGNGNKNFSNTIDELTDPTKLKSMLSDTFPVLYHEIFQYII